MRRYLLVVIAVVLATTGCAAAVSTADPGNQLAPSQDRQGSGQLATVLQPLQGTSLDEKPFSPDRLAGKSVVLWFWAPWCTICRGEAPSVARAAAELGNDVTFVGVPGLGTRNEMQQFVDDTGVGGFRHLPDDNGDIWKAYGIASQPAWVFITSSGKASTFNGALGYDKIIELAANLPLDR